MEDLAVGIFGSKATLVMTNVAGPQQPLYMAGSLVDRPMFWVPHPGALGMGISILSYDGAVTLGVVADAGLVPDPRRSRRNSTPNSHRLHAAVAEAQRPDSQDRTGNLCGDHRRQAGLQNRPLSGSPLAAYISRA